MNNRVRARVRIVVLFVLPLAGLYLLSLHIGESQVEQMPAGLLEALRTAQVFTTLGALASFWLHSYDRSRFVYALFYTGLAFGLVGVAGLAAAILRKTVHNDFDFHRDAYPAGLMLFLGTWLAAKGLRRARLGQTT